LGRECGADINRTDNAHELGHEAVVLCLAKQYGTDVNLATYGSTPLMTAARYQYEKIINIL
jgi:hypothetical protein